MRESLMWAYLVIHLVIFTILLWRIAIVPFFTGPLNILQNRRVLLEQNQVVSLKQAAFLAITLVISTADVFLPKLIAMDAGKDAWIAVILSGVETLSFLTIILYFLKKFPDKNFAMIIKDSFPKVVAMPLLFVFTMFLTQKASLSARELGEVVLNGFLTETPIEIIVMLIIIFTGYAVKKGLQPIARSNDLLLSVGVTTLFFVIFMLLSSADFKNYLPVLENGIKPVIKGSLPSMPWLTDLVLLLCLIFPSIDNKKNVGKYFSMSLLFIIAALELGTLAIAVFGVNITKNQIFPALEMVRVVRITDFLERLEVPLITVWIAGIFIKISFIYYAITDTFKIWLGLKNRLSLVWPIGLIIFGLCIRPFENMAKMLYCIHKILPYYTIVFYIFVILVLAAASFKKLFSSAKRDSRQPVQY